MPYDTIEIYVRNLSEEEATDWLEEILSGLEKVQGAPIVTYEGKYEGRTVPVQVTEHVQGGPYTSLWFNAPETPWSSTSACAREAHEALGKEVLCYPERGRESADGSEHPDEPWTLLQFTADGEAYVDEREIDF